MTTRDPGGSAATDGPLPTPTPAAPQTVVRTEPLGGVPLAAAAIAGTVPPGWYPECPRDPRAWTARIERVRAESGKHGWLDALWPAIEAEGPAATRLRRAATQGVVVTTGQQPGLFGGPVYTWTKAIGVLALANALEQATGVPVAPVFWAATDDTDFAEASTTWVSARGGVQALTATPAAAPGAVLAGAPLGDLTAALSGLMTASGSAPYAHVLDAVRAAYTHDSTSQPPTTAGSAFVTLLRRVLGPLGIAVIDASHAAVRRRAYPTLVHALQREGVVASALAARNREIAEHGYTPQVSDVAALTLVFEWSGVGSKDGGTDTSLDEGPAPIGATKTRVPRARASEAAGRAPAGTLSGNVLLRPVVERSILPTVAYLAGPGELAYFAQTSAVADALELPQPLALPRWSCTLIEPATAALMARYGLTEGDLRDAHGPERRLARAALPPAVREALDAVRAAVDRGVDAVAAADTGGLVPTAAIDGARVDLRHRLARLERRYLAAAKHTDATTMADLATVRGALLPNGERQERTLNFVPFLARGGLALLEAMGRAAARHAADLLGGGSSATR
jgi:bacillithiol biosynthesis cysteine-adding enzyme BshC